MRARRVGTGRGSGESPRRVRIWRRPRYAWTAEPAETVEQEPEGAEPRSGIQAHRRVNRGFGGGVCSVVDRCGWSPCHSVPSGHYRPDTSGRSPRSFPSPARGQQKGRGEEPRPLAALLVGESTNYYEEAFFAQSASKS